ncbi:MAG: Ig-like domain repeat protein, partial [Terriglobales bacterium]
MLYLTRVSRYAIWSATATLVLAVSALAQTRESSTVPIIITVAGCCEPNGGAGYGGDGGPATSAYLNELFGVALDAAGNLYIADYQNDIIRKVTASTGIITTVAGMPGVYAYGGDGGPATQASMELPQGLAVDSAGNIYIADNNDCLIRKVTASTGIITTVAGNTTGAGLDTHKNCKYGGDGGPATSAYLQLPGGVAVDSAGNIYIVDNSNERIRKVTVATGIITTAAGTGTGGYSGDGGPATSAEILPIGVAVGSAGNFYIADGSNRIRKVTVATGIINTVAGNGTAGYSGDGGPATGAEMDSPQGVTLDSAGDIFIGDRYNSLVRKVTTATGIITTVAGDYALGPGYTGDGGPATSAQMKATIGVAVDPAGDIFIADHGNNVVRTVTGINAATTTTLISSGNPSGLLESVTFTATVSPSGTPNPTGTVTFSANGSFIAGCLSVTLSASLTATCSTSALPSGMNAIVAAYSGNLGYYEGSFGTLTQVVLPATATTVASSLNPSTSGNSVTLTATISPAGSPNPSGTVDFTSLGAAISGCSSIALSSSLAATCTTSALPVGTDAIVASYSGDSNYAGSSGTLSQLVNPIPTPVQFFSVTPCRIVDTRGADGPFGGPELAAGETRSFTIPSGPCAGIPSTALAYSLNVTVVPPAPLGYLTIWPAAEGQPSVSTLNSLDGRVKANAAIVPAGASGAVSVYANNATNVLLDINGYFATSGSSSLEFYPLTPCRVADTRKADGPLGGPELVA